MEEVNDGLEKPFNRITPRRIALPPLSQLFTKMINAVRTTPENAVTSAQSPGEPSPGNESTFRRTGPMPGEWYDSEYPDKK